MGKHIKNKLFAGISVFLIMTLIFSVVPQMGTNVQAGTLCITWHDLETQTAMTVEAGSKFYIGDYVMILSEDTHATGVMVNATYMSSDKNVATVNKKGFLNAKKAGITKVTAR